MVTRRLLPARLAESANHASTHAVRADVRCSSTSDLPLCRSADITQCPRMRMLLLFQGLHKDLTMDSPTNGARTLLDSLRVKGSAAGEPYCRPMIQSPLTLPVAAMLIIRCWRGHGVI